jgi:hypothetical protein
LGAPPTPNTPPPPPHCIIKQLIPPLLVTTHNILRQVEEAEIETLIQINLRSSIHDE